MLLQRAIQRSIPKLSARAHANFRSSAARIKPPGLGRAQVSKRFLETQPVKGNEAYEILAKQRLNRPSSPHLTIYKPQVTWINSILNRITGCILSGGIYVFATAYLVAPAFGWHLESTTLAEKFGRLPSPVKWGIKFLIALPFTFHSINGIRHLAWDTGRLFTNKQVIRSGWTANALTVLGSGILASV